MLASYTQRSFAMRPQINRSQQAIIHTPLCDGVWFLVKQRKHIEHTEKFSKQQTYIHIYI